MEVSLVEYKNLKVSFNIDKGVLHALGGVDFSIKRGETIGIVGESGCGKSVTALSTLRLLSDENSKITGEIIFEGKDILSMNKKEIRSMRGKNYFYGFSRTYDIFKSSL